MKKVINVFNILIDKLQKNHIDEYTAQCAYFTLLAFIPLIMLILTLTKYVGIDEKTLFIIIEKISTGNILYSDNSFVNMFSHIFHIFYYFEQLRAYA